MIVIVMGVAGAGKTTVGSMLAARLGWQFIEGDDSHAPGCVAKMRKGIPLNDPDREPWISRLADLIRGVDAESADAVLACSALRQTHRDRLRAAGDTRLVYLKTEAAVLRRRLKDRSGHFMPASLLTSQMEALEEPVDALDVDARQAPGAIVDAVIDWLGVASRLVRPDGGLANPPLEGDCPDARL